jgi:hypothetical protein
MLVDAFTYGVAIQLFGMLDGCYKFPEPTVNHTHGNCDTGLALLIIMTEQGSSNFLEQFRGDADFFVQNVIELGVEYCAAVTADAPCLFTDADVELNGDHYPFDEMLKIIMRDTPHIHCFTPSRNVIQNLTHNFTFLFNIISTILRDQDVLDIVDSDALRVIHIISSLFGDVKIPCKCGNAMILQEKLGVDEDTCDALVDAIGLFVRDTHALRDLTAAYYCLTFEDFGDYTSMLNALLTPLYDNDSTYLHIISSLSTFLGIAYETTFYTHSASCWLQCFSHGMLIIPHFVDKIVRSELTFLGLE